MKIAFTWDDGARNDLRLIDLHEKYAIPGMFFIPNRNVEGREVLSQDQLRETNHGLIHFGGHTENHVYLTKINIQDVENEVKKNKEYLENIVGDYQSIDHFCFPGGQYTKEIANIVLKYYKSVRTADTMCFTTRGQIVKPTFHMYPRGIKSMLGNSLRNRSWREMLYVASHFNDDYFSTIRHIIDYEATVNDSKVIIWGHSWEIEALGLWNEVDELMCYIAENYSDMIVPYENIIEF